MSAHAHAASHPPTPPPQAPHAVIGAATTSIDEWTLVEARMVCATVDDQLADAGASLARLCAATGLDPVTLDGLLEATEGIAQARHALANALNSPTINAA